jgi:LuxR family maltose regulon positive regulatory protein
LKTKDLLKNLSAYESRTLIWNGDKAAADTWLRNYFVDENSFGEFYKSYRNFTTVRAYILLEQTDKAAAALVRLKTLAESYDRPLDAAEADILLSVTEWWGGKRKEARDRLLDTLADVYPYGFIRVAANEGKAVLPILSAILKKLEKEDGGGELHKFIREVYYAAYERSRHFKGIVSGSVKNAVVRLSPQQKHVLELLSRGYKNAEIVKETGLSLNTIRTHTKLAYQKLGVSNSLDAVARAKLQGILD